MYIIIDQQKGMVTKLIDYAFRIYEETKEAK